MNHEQQDKITLYTSSWCMQSRSVERFIEKHGIEAEIINIDGNAAARETLIQINNGYASVPTLIFPDGSKLTEPSMAALKRKLEMEPSPSLKSRIKQILTKNGD